MASSSSAPSCAGEGPAGGLTAWRGRGAALRASRRPREIIRHSAPALCLLPALALYATFVLWPLARLAYLSLQRWDGLSTPSFVGLSNYAAIFADPGFAAELRHTLVWLAVTLTVPVLLGLLLALALRAVSPTPRALLRALLLLPLVFPTVLIAVAWKLFYNPLSGPLTGALQALHRGAWTRDWLGDPNMALPALLVPACWASFGLSMLICEAALARVSGAVLAAAELDGAGAWMRLWAITLPALRGALPLATVVTGLCAVPSYDLILLMTNGGPGYATTTITFDAYGRAFGGIGQVGDGAALACLQSVVGLALVLLALLAARGQQREEDDGEAGMRCPLGRCRRWAALAVGLPATALALAPILWLMALAIRPSGGIGMSSGLAANLASVGAQGFGGAALTSFGVALVVAAATLLVAVPAAFALAGSRRRALIVPAAIGLAVGLFQPTAVLIIPLFSTLEWLNLLDSPLGVILPQVARVLPLAVLLLWTGMRGLPRGVLEAAALDGAAPRQALWLIVLPLLLPLVVVVGVWSFLASWNDYLLPTVAIEDGSMQTVPLALAHFIGRFDTQYALLATGALLAALPLLAIYAGLYGIMAQGLRRIAPGTTKL
jgi:raffinose/stachyose/melibiose transport system permease protein